MKLPKRHGHHKQQILLEFSSQMMDSIEEMSGHTTNNELEFSNSGREAPVCHNQQFVSSQGSAHA
jgi:hypothetical protein